MSTPGLPCCVVVKEVAAGRRTCFYGGKERRWLEENLEFDVATDKTKEEVQE